MNKEINHAFGMKNALLPQMRFGLYVNVVLIFPIIYLFQARSRRCLSHIRSKYGDKNCWYEILNVHTRISETNQISSWTRLKHKGPMESFHLFGCLSVHLPAISGWIVMLGFSNFCDIRGPWMLKIDEHRFLGKFSLA